MKMKNKKLIVLTILSIVAVFSLLYGIFTPSRTKREHRKEIDIQTKEAVTIKEGIISFVRYAKRSNYSSWGRNPFLLQVTPIRTFGGLILNGIMWDKKNPLAIINEEIVKIGDKVDGNTVVGIEQDRAILNDGNKNIELLLGQ